MAVSALRFDPPDDVVIKRALLSVSDKTGIVDLARALLMAGAALVSTGGTRDALERAGLPVTDVSQMTGFPEIMDGRVKTLHPSVHGALLGVRNNKNHARAMKAHKMVPIDLVVVNLYPFEQVIEKGADEATALENIDIGGPAMIRAAAKNHAYVGVVTDPADYQALITEIEKNGAISLEQRRRYAAKAIALTAAYDAAIANWFATILAIETPEKQTLSGTLHSVLRYGENPHQKAAFYKTGNARPGVASATQIQGKALSFNNINDTNAAFELVAEFDDPNHAAIVMVKHTNPCGVAQGETLVDAYRKALLCDPVSAFGAIIAMNRVLDAEAAEEIVKTFTEVIIAPDVTKEARTVIAAKKNLRLLVTGGLPEPRASGLDIRSVAGGLLVQQRDRGVISDLTLKTVTKRAASDQEMDDLRFAFKVAKHVKSNAIIYAKKGAITGIGAGQMSRVDASNIAARKAEEAARKAGLSESLAVGSVVASDAFFPFADGLLAAANAGATAIIQPGGSQRDEEVIAAADEAGLAMIFTGMRHFRH